VLYNTDIQITAKWVFFAACVYYRITIFNLLKDISFRSDIQFDIVALILPCIFFFLLQVISPFLFFLLYIYTNTNSLCVAVDCSSLFIAL